MPGTAPGPSGRSIYSRPMRRWLMILLLFAMPFQSSWAAAAGYCQHESSAEASHFGHHKHQHASGAGASAQDADAPSDPLLGSPDNDCLACHACTAQPLSNPGNLPAMGGSPERPQALTEPYRSHVAGVPTRPAWPTSA